MKKNKKQLIIILVISILVLLPLFLTNGYIINDDSKFHIANVFATLKSMKTIIPSDVLPDLFGNYGIAIRQFYPILPHTFIAIFTKITTFDVSTMIKLTHLLELFLSGVTMYFLALRFKDNKNYALVASVIYMLFPYHLNEIYVRDAINESFLFIFLPIIIIGLTYLFEDKKKFLIYFCFGYILGMLSHLTMMVYFTVLIMPFFIMNIKKVLKKDTIITLIEASLIILLVMSPTIVNMFQNKLMGDYRVFTPYVMAQGIAHSGLWSDYINYLGLLKNNSWNGFSLPDHLFYIDIVALLLFIATITIYIISIIKKKKIKYDRNLIFVIIFGILSFWLSSILFPWDNLPISFRIIQFPWRLETFLAISMSIVAPMCLMYVKDIYKYLIVILMVILALIFHTTTPHIEKYDFNNIDYEMGIGWQKEYLPNKTYDNLEYIKSLDYKVISNNGDAIIDEDSFPNLKFTLTENSEVQLPRVFYFGYELYDENHNTHNIYENEYGLIGSNLEKGTYELKYTRTNLVKIARIISFITLILFLIYLFKDKLLKRK